MTNEEQTGHPRRHGKRTTGFFIPAGLFIGLGIGLILGNPGVGVLIGLGAGFLASALGGFYLEAPPEEVSKEEVHSGHGAMSASRWFMVLIGIFIILMGVGLIYAPLQIWPYVIAGFLVILGIWFIVKGMSRN